MRVDRMWEGFFFLWGSVEYGYLKLLEGWVEACMSGMGVSKMKILFIVLISWAIS